MEYDDSSENIDDEYSRKVSTDDVDDEGTDLEEIEEEDAEASDKSRPNLEVRRAIEDHLERTRLRKELDYLFDDEFGRDDEEE